MSRVLLPRAVDLRYLLEEVLISMALQQSREVLRIRICRLEHVFLSDIFYRSHVRVRGANLTASREARMRGAAVACLLMRYHYPAVWP